MREDD